MNLSLFINQCRRAKIACLVFTVWIASASAVQAQTDSTKKHSEPVSNTFRGAQLINMPTNEIIDGFQFGIQHYFGEVVPSQIVYNFLGMDLGANIRFSLAYPIIKDRLQVELGRTNETGSNDLGKTVDLAIKYQVLRQTKDNKMPVSVALYVDPSIATSDYPAVPANAFFADEVTPFQYSFAQRIDYNSQLIITRKFNKKFSLELAPALIYQNLVPAGFENQTWVVQLGARYKFSDHGAVLLNYGYIFNSRDSVILHSSANSITKMVLYPLSVGVEFSTAGHVFQIMLSSSQDILGKDIYTVDNANYTNGDFYIGFNITRTF